MFGYMLQDWVTIQSAASIMNLVQTDDGWMTFDRFQDLTFFVETSAIVLGGATNVALVLESSPTRDEVLFVTLSTITAALTDMERGSRSVRSSRGRPCA